MLQLLIADDHPVVRRGLKQIIEEASDMVVADEATTGLEVLNKVRANGYDMIILDVTMPGMDGLDVLIQLRYEKPKLPVLILSMHSEEQYAVRAIRAGASGYLTKESMPNELLTAIRKIASGGKYVSSSLAERFAGIIQGNPNKLPHESLSNREYQVMSHIASGKTVAEIAKLLSLSVKTVSTYRSRILRKINVKSDAQLTRYAIDNRLL